MLLSWLRQPSQNKSKAAVRRPIRLQLESLEERIVLSGGITFEPTSLPPATVGIFYFDVVTIGDQAGLKSLNISGLPFPVNGYSESPAAGEIDGLSFSHASVYIPGMEIMGRPTNSGTITFTVSATDWYGNSASQNYTLTVNPSGGNPGGGTTGGGQGGDNPIQQILNLINTLINDYKAAVQNAENTAGQIIAQIESGLPGGPTGPTNSGPGQPNIFKLVVQYVEHEQSEEEKAWQKGLATVEYLAKDFVPEKVYEPAKELIETALRKAVAAEDIARNGEVIKKLGGVAGVIAKVWDVGEIGKEAFESGSAFAEHKYGDAFKHLGIALADGAVIGLAETNPGLALAYKLFGEKPFENLLDQVAKQIDHAPAQLE